ncbi:hypothetical protein VdG1_03476 [Verticillium dahliae VDG1]|nr:hypothetical protein VdG1_03476 [Verticillium dahliae VDG1]
MAPAATAIKDMDLRSGLKRGPPKGSWSNDIKIEEMPSKKNKTSPTQPQRTGLATPSSPQLTDASAPSDDLASLLYSPQVTAKIWGIAQQGFNSPNPPTLFPEYTKPGGTKYVYRELDFWTSGFFPGSLYLLLERQQKYGHRHARTTRKYHVREDSSTCHVVVFEPDTGAFRARITNQGHADGSAWTRGQAWAIAGFAQTYGWTREVEFLDTAVACAEYFLAELPVSRIPPWDFRAPGEGPQPTDTSAAVIAAYGLLLIHEAFVALGKESGYLEHALSIVRAVTRIEVEIGAECETILGGATINNYEFAPRRWANHGLVYADYYFLLFGNKLLEMGLDVKLMGGV